MEAYRLATGAVECGDHGVFVGGVALLKRCANGIDFEPRAIDAINEDLSRRYGAPVDIVTRISRLSFVASHLQKGELALAQIGALLLRFPDPPSETPNAAESTEGKRSELLTKLSAAGLLKADEDWESKHPRLDGPPNRAWFATKPKNELIVRPNSELIEQPKSGLPSQGGWLRSALAWLSRNGRFGAMALRMGLVLAEKVSFFSSLGDYIKSLLEGPQIEGSTGDVEADEIGAAKDPPKTLEELQTEPTRYRLGYDRHHIVEQNPANIAKRQRDWQMLLRKFGRAMIDDPSNIVWIPRSKHWRVTAIYNRKEDGDPLGRLHRQVVNQLDFAAQREAGLAALRQEGILK